jgi:hypothetical protein
MPRAWTRRFVTQQGPQFARTEGLFLFARGTVRINDLGGFSQAIMQPSAETAYIDNHQG